MKKYNQILKDIKKVSEELKIAKTERETVEADFWKLFDESSESKLQFLKNHPEEREAKQNKLSEISETVTDLNLTLAYLRNNARVALYTEILPDVLEVWNKYQGKPYGDRTAEKIRNEIFEKCGCSVYLTPNSYGADISFYPEQIERFSCYTRYIAGKKINMTNEDNKIVAITADYLQVENGLNYCENIKKAIKDLKKYRAEAAKIKEQLKSVCNKYNEFTVPGIENIRHDAYSIDATF